MKGPTSVEKRVRYYYYDYDASNPSAIGDTVNRTVIMLLAAVALCVDSPAFAKKNLAANADGVVVPQPYKTGRFVKTPRPDILGDLKFMKEDEKIAVPFFRVRFIKNTKKAASSSSGGLPSQQVEAKQIIETTLAGVDDATMQAITDEAYADLVKKLKDSGIGVLTGADVASTAYFSKELNDAYPEHDKGDSAFVATGTKWGGIFKLPRAMAHVMDEAKAGVIMADYSLNFVAYGAFDRGDLTDARAEVQYGQSAHAGATLKGLRYKDAKCKRGACEPSRSGQGDVKLGQVTYSMKPFGTFADTTSGGAHLSNAISGAASLMGGRSVTSRSQKTLTADPVKYKEAALEALFEANTRLVNSLKA